MGGGSSATSMVNSAIDNASSATDFFDKLMENKTYYNQYHAYLQQLVDKYVNGGGFDKFYERVRSQTEAETLYQVVKLRGKSIEGQLNGTIPSTAEEQKTSDTLVDSSSIDLTVMGTIMNGGDPPTPADNDTDTSSEQTDTQTANLLKAAVARNRNVLFQIFLKERFQLLKWDHVHPIVKVGVVCAGDNEQFLIIAGQLAVRCLTEIAGVHFLSVYQQHGGADLAAVLQNRHI